MLSLNTPIPRALSMAGARRLLEEDLGLHKDALEPFKKFINKEIEVVRRLFKQLFIKIWEVDFWLLL